ncbi:MAG: TIGR01440 family protein [Lachnospiraceae bacterium]|nr:TIGR01440 family protein [Lachnospiraceae bacterium]
MENSTINPLHLANITIEEDVIKKITDNAAAAAEELCKAGRLNEHSILVVGCSSSEVIGEHIGTFSSPQVAAAILTGIQSVLEPLNIFLAAQCCEHLNRAIIIEKNALKYTGMYISPVNVVPQPKAGGSFATAAYHSFNEPVAVESIKADAGIDIGGTLIGMHLKEVAVPVRLTTTSIGNASIICARTRPKFIGGIRAGYDDSLL